jgi:hypothetical protein
MRATASASGRGCVPPEFEAARRIQRGGLIEGLSQMFSPQPQPKLAREHPCAVAFPAWVSGFSMVAFTPQYGA